MCKSKALGGRCNGYLNKRLVVAKKKLDDRVDLMISSGVLSRKIALEKEQEEHYNTSRAAKEAGNMELSKAAYASAKEMADEVKAARSELNYFKDETAHLAIKYNVLQTERDRRDGKFVEYEGDSIGLADKTVTFPSNSPEWHEQRAKAIGGSDVGAIMGVSPFTNRAKIFKDKTEPNPNKSVDQKAYKGGAFYRGDAWEPNIVRMFADKNADKKILHSKSSWAHRERPYQQANVDGLICENGSETPNAILEIKTSSSEKSWKNGVPEEYRMQTLWYMDTFNMKKAYLAVLIDDHDYRQYEITPKPGEIENIRSEMSKFMDEVNIRKSELEAEKASAKAAA
jgi:putative phage-type endonuclease